MTTTVMMRALAVATAALIAACSPQQRPRPELPGEGPDHEGPDGSGRDDPWADRDLIEPPDSPAPAAVPLPEVARVELENGLEVLVIEDATIPVVEMHVAVRAGEREVSRDKAGLARMAAQLLTHGTRDRDALAIAEAIDFVGGALSARAGHEATWLSCEVLAKDLSTCLELVPEVLTRPAFPEDEREQVGRRLRSEIRARFDDAGQLAGQHLRNELWGDDHVRGWIISETSLDAIARDDLVAWHERWFSPENAVVAIAGDVDADALAGELEEAFGAWEPREVPERPRYDAAEIEGLTVRLVDKPDQTQAHIRLGHPGISRHDDDFHDVMVMNYVLGGGGFSSRLVQVLRAEEGKTYGASSSFDQSADRGAFVATTFTRTRETVATAELMLDEIRKLAAQGPSDREVERAIGNLAARYAMQFETPGDVARALLAARVRGLAERDVRDYPLAIGEVTPAAAREAAARRLDPDGLAAVIVGPAEEIAPQLDRAGWRYEIVGHHEPVAAYERRAARAAAEAPVDPEAAAAAVEILDRALAAKGGYERLSAIDTVVIEARAEVEMGPQTLPASMVRKLARPDRIRVDVDIRGGIAEVTTAYDGEQGWMRQAGGGQEQIVDLPESERQAVEAELWRDAELILLRHRDEGTIAEALGERVLDDAPHHALRLRSEDGHEAVLYIDTANHRLRQMTYTGADGGTTTETFGDYREVDGIAVAHERKAAGPQQSLTLEVQRIIYDRELDAELFARPAD